MGIARQMVVVEVVKMELGLLSMVEASLLLLLSRLLLKCLADKHHHNIGA